MHLVTPFVCAGVQTKLLACAWGRSLQGRLPDFLCLPFRLNDAKRSAAQVFGLVDVIFLRDLGRSGVLERASIGVLWHELQF